MKNQAKDSDSNVLERSFEYKRKIVLAYDRATAGESYKHAGDKRRFHNLGKVKQDKQFLEAQRYFSKTKAKEPEPKLEPLQPEREIVRRPNRKKTSTKVPFCVYVEKDVLSAFKALSESSGTTVAELVRNALETRLNRV